MYQGKRISVAMASYNGERFIREQLESILRQTVIPDEIVISDDGSTDNTLAIIQETADSFHFPIKLIHNSEKHGVLYNFLNALQNTTGDLLFLADQDDIWVQDKVERVASVMVRCDNILCVFHNADSIDSNGKPIEAEFNQLIAQYAKECMPGGTFRIKRAEYLESAVSTSTIHGMVMCIDHRLLKTALPFPDCNFGHDGWLWFCSVASDACVFLNEILTHRRLHGYNTSGAGKHSGFFRQIKKVLMRIRGAKTTHLSLLVYIRNVSRYLDAYCDPNTPEYIAATRTVNRITEIGKKQLDAAKSSRLIGAAKLLTLYVTDIRYRRIGLKSFSYELADILLRSKIQRASELREFQL